MKLWTWKTQKLILWSKMTNINYIYIYLKMFSPTWCKNVNCTLILVFILHIIFYLLLLVSLIFFPGCSQMTPSIFTLAQKHQINFTVEKLKITKLLPHKLNVQHFLCGPHPVSHRVTIYGWGETPPYVCQIQVFSGDLSAFSDNFILFF